jgi:N,N-dimethylformamidase
VSSAVGIFRARCVRLTGAIGTPSDWSAHAVPAEFGVAPTHRGVLHTYPSGSYLRLDVSAAGVESFGVAVRVHARARPIDDSSLVQVVGSAATLTLRIDVRSRLHVEIAGDDGGTWSREAGLALEPLTWYDVDVRFDAARRVVSAGCAPLAAGAAEQRSSAPVPLCPGHARTVLIGGRADAVSPTGARGDLDAKIENPRWWPNAGRIGSPAEWDLGALPYDDAAVPEITSSLPPGELVNAPKRAVTSSGWHGQVTDFRCRPDLYAAVALHRDDLHDARWPQSFQVCVPRDATSGVYCVLVSVEDEIDFADPFSFYPMTFVVAPAPERRQAVAVVLPTFSYRTYASNAFYAEADPDIYLLRGPTWSAPMYDYALRHMLRSAYDTHADGDGVSLVSLLRPHVFTRPDHHSQLIGVPHQLGADLQIVQWLEAIGQPYDVLTDEYLHEEGTAALDGHRVAITGTHPEYASSCQLDAFEGFIGAGGNLMSMGGNSFITRVEIDDHRPELLELRRGDFGQIWDSAPGEMHHQTTGEAGGLWRRIGRPPNLLTGLGFSAIGFSGDGTYVRPGDTNLAEMPGELREVFEEIGPRPFGVCGLELDSYDTTLGSPAQAVVLGRLNEVPIQYEPTPEYQGELYPRPVEALRRNLRANIVWFLNRGGGRTFAVGSIRWSSGLNLKGDPSYVRRITTAALRSMLGAS